MSGPVLTPGFLVDLAYSGWVEKVAKGKLVENKAGYTAQDAPSSPSKITRDIRTDGPTAGPTDGRTDTTSYRDATAHLKTRKQKR